mmetsp:Transcript_24554/g.32558  ORF Transcript_24554/g.32558 Transcript_24554/m.32558 type:complete len:749 (+) Transcript_24554:407-2653(+)
MLRGKKNVEEEKKEEWRYSENFEHFRKLGEGKKVANFPEDMRWKDIPDFSIPKATADAKCYGERYPKVQAQVCKNNTDCSPHKLFKHFQTVGRHKDRVWGCVDDDEIQGKDNSGNESNTNMPNMIVKEEGLLPPPSEVGTAITELDEIVAQCYLDRYPGLKKKWCKKKLKSHDCGYKELHQHFSTIGAEEGRYWGCDEQSDESNDEEIKEETNEDEVQEVNDDVENTNSDESNENTIVDIISKSSDQDKQNAINQIISDISNQEEEASGEVQTTEEHIENDDKKSDELTEEEKEANEAQCYAERYPDLVTNFPELKRYCPHDKRSGCKPGEVKASKLLKHFKINKDKGFIWGCDDENDNYNQDIENEGEEVNESPVSSSDNSVGESGSLDQEEETFQEEIEEAKEAEEERTEENGDDDNRAYDGSDENEYADGANIVIEDDDNTADDIEDKDVIADDDNTTSDEEKYSADDDDISTNDNDGTDDVTAVDINDAEDDTISDDDGEAPDEEYEDVITDDDNDFDDDDNVDAAEGDDGNNLEYDDDDDDDARNVIRGSTARSNEDHRHKSTYHCNQHHRVRWKRWAEDASTRRRKQKSRKHIRDIIQYLLDIYPHAARVKDRFGFLPFRLAEVSGRRWDDGLGSLLYEYPRSILVHGHEEEKGSKGGDEGIRNDEFQDVYYPHILYLVGPLQLSSSSHSGIMKNVTMKTTIVVTVVTNELLHFHYIPLRSRNCDGEELRRFSSIDFFVHML